MNNRYNKNLKKKHSKIEGKTSFEVLKQELKWNKNRKHNFCRGYRCRLRLTQKKEKKSAWELKKAGLKSYNIKAL